MKGGMEKREGGRRRGRGLWKKGREGGGGEGGMEKREGGCKKNKGGREGYGDNREGGREEETKGGRV